MARILCLGVQRQRYALAMVRSIPWRRRVLWQQLADTAPTLRVDDKASQVTRRLPPQFVAPANEWYSWMPSPRANKDVKVLLTLDTSNYPLGFKDTLTSGDIPVVWTNTKYRMLYMNMGHGDKIFTDAHQNDLFEDALHWLGGRR